MTLKDLEIFFLKSDKYSFFNVCSLFALGIKWHSDRSDQKSFSKVILCQKNSYL